MGSDHIPWVLGRIKRGSRLARGAEIVCPTHRVPHRVDHPRCSDTAGWLQDHRRIGLEDGVLAQAGNWYVIIAYPLQEGSTLI